MSIYYDFKKGPERKEEETSSLLYPHVISNGTITTREMLESIAARSTFTEGELEGMLTMLTDEVIFGLLNGYRVQLGEMGYFSLKLKADREVTDKKEIRAESIRVHNVNFRPAINFRKKLRGDVRRNPYKVFRKSGTLNKEERKQKLLEYLANNPYITRTQYTDLTGVLKNRALQDLHSFVKEGLLKCMGRSPHLWFTLP